MAAAMDSLATVTERIEALYLGLSPQLRQAARYLLEEPEDVALNSMRRVAARAGVQPATMVRLARALDFPGYGELREPFRAHLRGERGYAQRARALFAHGGASASGTLLQSAASHDLANIQQTYDELAPERFAAIVAVLAEARRLYVVGLRKCYPLAAYFHYAYDMFADNMVLAASRGGLLTDALKPIAAGDALLAIGFRRYTRETVQAVALARHRGASVVAITDSRLSPLAVADHVLVAAKASPSFFGSLVGALALIQALIAGLVRHAGADAIAHLAETEHYLDSFATYWEGAQMTESQP